MTAPQPKFWITSGLVAFSKRLGFPRGGEGVICVVFELEPGRFSYQVSVTAPKYRAGRQLHVQEADLRLVSRLPRPAREREVVWTPSARLVERVNKRRRA